jgi:hypothetical protein
MPGSQLKQRRSRLLFLAAGNRLAPGLYNPKHPVTGRLQNVHLPDVQLQNVQVTKRPDYQTSLLPNIQFTKRPVTERPVTKRPHW